MKKLDEILPKMEYNGVLISDITHRFVVSGGITQYKDFFYQRRINQHHTPEAVSQVLYGTTDYWWVICAVNNVIDPFYDWIMREGEVEAYANKLYDNVNDIHHWEDVEYNEYAENNVDETLKPITNIEYEIYMNDKKLQINTVKPKYIQFIVKELQDIAKSMKIQVQE